MNHEGGRPLRIGAVSYLNSKPLIEGLGELAPAAELVLDYPSRLADELEAGRLEVALIPSFDYLRHGGYSLVSDACVACRGPVYSVKLFCRVPPGEIARLALDEGSRTSAVLARIVLAERYGVEPQIEALPLGRSVDATDADAVLLIGDRAMRVARERFEAVWDLGREWNEWTGLPFVFAVWAARDAVLAAELAPVLAAARDRGVERAAEIARREAPALGISGQSAYDYLTRHLHFRLASAEWSGLELFRQLAQEQGLLPRKLKVDESTVDRSLQPVE